MPLSRHRFLTRAGAPTRCIYPKCVDAKDVGAHTPFKHKGIFIAVIEIEHDNDDLDNVDMAHWIESAMYGEEGRVGDITVYDTPDDLVADLWDMDARKKDSLLQRLLLHRAKTLLARWKGE